MNDITDKLFQEALSLPSHLRSVLIDKLIESLNVPIDKEIDESWSMEAEKRVDEVNSGKIKSIPGEKVIKDIHDRFSNEL